MSLVPSNEPQRERPARMPGAGVMSPATNGNIGIPVETGELANRLDIYGAIMRRKFVVLLFAIVGGILGYFYYQNQPRVFSSSLRLVIWSQNPPTIIDQDSMMRTSSIPKHKNLIISEAVFEEAIRDNSLAGLETFEGTAYPQEKLKRMLSVSSVDKSDNTLVVSAKGGIPDDLPIVLNKVVDAYRTMLEQDSKAVGEESVGLIEKLQSQQVAELEELETKYLKMVKGLGVTFNNEGGDFENPYVERYNQLRTERADLERNLVEVNDKTRLLKQAIDSKKDSQIAVAAIEGRKYLGLADAHRIDRISNPIDSRLSLKIDSFEQKVLELQFSKNDMSRTFGPKSPQMRRINDEIEFWKAQLEILQTEEREFENMDSEIASEDDIKNKQELQWISLYSVALAREQQRLSNLFEITDQELTRVSAEATKISGQVAEVNVLRKQIEEKRNAARVVLARLSVSNVMSDDYNKFKIRVIDNPKAGYQIAPSFPRNLGTGIFLASLLGLGLALLIDRVDMSFRTPTEIFGRLGVPVIGRIPKIRLGANRSGDPVSATLVTINKPESVASESFRAARTAIFFAMNSHQYKSFLVTSPMPGDGKSTIACNIAVSIAQAGKRILLIDSDFRKPRVHQYMAESIGPGITEVLSGEYELNEALRPSLQDNLDLLTTGKRPKNPGELVTSSEFRSLLETLKDKYDVIIIDSPPVLPVADATVISGYVDGVYLAMRIRKGIKIAAQRARENLVGVKANLLGVIVNGMDENPHYNEYGYYGYGQYGGNYGTAPYEESPPAPRRRKVTATPSSR